MTQPKRTTPESIPLSNGCSEMPTTPTVYVCVHQHCRDRGSEQTLTALSAQVPDQTIVCPSQCMGQCSSGPTVRVAADETWYYRVHPEDVDTIVEQHLIGGQPVTEKLNPRLHRTFYG